MVRKSTSKVAPKPTSQPKGIAIEEALRLHFSGQGIFAIRSVPYRLENEDVTDIDLWLYESPGSTARRRTIVDIKHKKSPQAAERLIWTKGLQTALAVEAALVATTDRRTATQRLARTLKIGLVDFLPFQKIVSALAGHVTVIPQSDFEAQVREADAIRRTTEWRDQLTSLKGSLLTNLGFGSANRALIALAKIYEDGITSPASSERAVLAGRLTYFAAACAAVSLDYALSEFAFRSKDDRIALTLNGLRYGADANATIARIRASSALIEKYLPNGRHLAKMVESQFMAEAERLPAEIIAEHVTKQSANETLFQPALALLGAALAQTPPTFDSLPTATKALMGVFIDFSGGSREKFAKMWANGGTTPFVSTREGELPLPIHGKVPPSEGSDNG
ncbi:MAG: hypothetical protein M3Q19_12170 [Pseudomonadota bacterium]|nr:hypothetical protein [Pseudomonadota bacterium]